MTPDDFAAALTAMLEQIAPLREAVQGYREQLRRDGWSDAESESMASELHNALLRKMFSG